MEQPEANPTFCTNNCGFYGSSKFEGMCSKCYRDHVNRQCNPSRQNSLTSFSSSKSTETRLQDEDNSANLLDNTIDNSIDQLEIPSQLPHVASAPSISTNTDISSPIPEASSLGASPNVEKKKSNRCTWDGCKKKLGLTGFDCRCGGQFCSLHRYANEHHCTFDYKELGQNEIRKNMPVVQGERVRKL